MSNAIDLGTSNEPACVFAWRVQWPVITFARCFVEVGARSRSPQLSIALAIALELYLISCELVPMSNVYKIHVHTLNCVHDSHKSLMY